MEEATGTRRALEQRLESKQKEIVARLSGLRSELTRNPVGDLAKDHPLAVVGAALLVGILVGAMLHRREAATGFDTKELADSIADKVISELPASAASHIGADELRRIVRHEALAAVTGSAARPSAPSVFGQVLGTLGRNLVMEGVHYLMSRLSEPGQRA